MNIKKQISRLYLYEIVSGLQIVDAVWVFFLLERGFSLAQVGIAEGVFHAVSMCFEIPSGMVSDTIGRRKTLMLAGIVSAVSAFCMIVSDAFFMILLAMGINAVSYNLVSGTREALTYDSLLEAGEEKNYLKVASRQDFLYEGLFAFANLMSIVTVAIGYQKAYFLSILQGILCAFCASFLKEAMESERTFGKAGHLPTCFGKSERIFFKQLHSCEKSRRLPGVWHIPALYPRPCMWSTCCFRTIWWRPDWNRGSSVFRCF